MFTFEVITALAIRSATAANGYNSVCDLPFDGDQKGILLAFQLKIQFLNRAAVFDGVRSGSVTSAVPRAMQPALQYELADIPGFRLLCFCISTEGAQLLTDC